MMFTSVAIFRLLVLLSTGWLTAQAMEQHKRRNILVIDQENLGKVLECVVASQLQAVLDETDYLDPFQPGICPGYGAETALVTLVDGLHQETDSGSVTLLVLLHLSAAFDTIDHASCTHVPDFGTCQGNALNFCPKGVTCGCKDQAPFCKCPSYRNDWEDYWYMGPKCEQLWSTLDLIVVAAVPAVTLSVVAAVIMQWVNYCKRTPKDGARTHSQPRPQAQEIPRYAHNLDDGSRYIFPHRSEEDNRTVQNPKFPPIPLKEQPHEHPPLRRVKGSSYVPHPPLRRAMPEDANRPPYVKQPRYWEHETTNVDYEEENPFSVMGMRQFPKPGASPFLPPSDYDEDLPPVNYPNAGRPYRMAHPQNIYY